jgi:proteasome lid subunit RPN8/RPN11
MDSKLESAIKQCAISEYPNEMVGCVVGGDFIQLKNISTTPKERYRLLPKDKLLLFELGDSLTALVHSHPVMDNTFSETDLNAQKACRFPFWVVGTDGINTTDIREVTNEA